MKKRIVSLFLCLILLLGLIPTAQAALPFTDVKPDAWYYDEVAFAYENGLFNGTSATTFGPERTMNRGMLVTVLYRLSGEPAVSGYLPFYDVFSGDWYAAPVLWAYDNGIVNGIREGVFAPTQPVTREQSVAILYRYSNYLKCDTSARTDLRVYADDQLISKYAQEPMSWAVATGLLTGMPGNRLAPQGNTTRAQMSAIQMRFIQSYFPNRTPEAPETPDPPTGGHTHRYTIYRDNGNGSHTVYCSCGQSGGTDICSGPYTSLNNGYHSLTCSQCRSQRTETCHMITVSGRSHCILCDYTPPHTHSYTGYTYLGNGTHCQTCACGAQTNTQPCTGEYVYASGTYYTLCDYCQSKTALRNPTQATNTMQVGGKILVLGMSITDLIQLMGTPSEKLNSVTGMTWYLYGTTNYKNFMMVGTYNNQVVSLCGTGAGFRYMGYKAGDTGVYLSHTRTAKVRSYNDSNDGKRLHTVWLTLKSFDNLDLDMSSSYTHRQGESKLNFHMTNAFRVYHGLNKLTWTAKAATACQLHSEAMANKGFFAHQDPYTGTRAGDRLKAQGLKIYSWGKNIANGQSNAIAVHHAWIISSGHRTNMLNSKWTNMGVGMAYNGTRYYTQNFYNPNK